jgi:methyltransferase-like protein/SAM-dependent methyltransferase
MSSAAPTSYDDLPYESFAFSFTHPDRLATLGRLHGLTPPAVERCRLLELGCASGGNIIPMAFGLPQARLVGIDLSPRQIENAKKIVADLGLTNLDLQAMSITDVDTGLGSFDYIICHGVYSWVPGEVQEKILDIIAGHLRTGGVAYVSYNTYPGWQMRRMLREMLCYHVRQFPDPHAQVQQARSFINFLAQAVLPQEQSVYPGLLKGAAEVFRQSSDAYLLHEYLEEVNEPVYFHEFVKRLRAKGIQYVADTRLIEGLRSQFPASVLQTVAQLTADPIAHEQYLDFLRNQSFRRSLLSQSDPKLRFEPNPEAVSEFHVAAQAKPVSPPVQRNAGVVESFRGLGGAVFALDQSLLKSAFLYLNECWPRSVPFAELVDTARSGVTPQPDAASRQKDSQALQNNLLTGYLSDLVELSTRPQIYARASQNPLASSLARYQARTGNLVTNLRHQPVRLGDLDRHLLMMLDGSRDRTALVKGLADLVQQGVLAAPMGSGSTGDELRVHLASALEQHLELFGQSSLLTR